MTQLNRLQRLAVLSAPNECLSGPSPAVCVITILDLKPRHSVPPSLPVETVPFKWDQNFQSRQACKFCTIFYKSESPTKVLITKSRAFASEYLRVNKSILAAISARASKYRLNLVALHTCSSIWGGTVLKVCPVKLTKKKNVFINTRCYGSAD